MRVLLVGNYLPSGEKSMQRFADLLRRILEEAGHQVELVRPAPVFGRLKGGPHGLGKWLGYLDRFLLFPTRLGRSAAAADVVHICDQANAVYVPLLSRVPHVVTCHDMLAIRGALGEIPENPTRWSGRIYQRRILHGLRRAAVVVCVSERTGLELARIAARPARRTRVVANALPHPFRPMEYGEAEARIGRAGIGPGWAYFLHVGGNVWYKNRPGVVRIFRRLANRPGYDRHHLVLAGEPWPRELRRLVAESGLEDRVHELVDVGDEDLRALYALAQALLFPSLREGFGWPIVEAQACGCPVVVADRAPMMQVAGGAAIGIDPTDETAAAEAVARTLETTADRLVVLGLRNAARYTAAAMAGGYVDAYREAIARLRD